MSRVRAVVVVGLCALAAAGCSVTGQSAMSLPSGPATVAFESIDGPPPAVFAALVQAMDHEAKARALPVVSRAAQSTYRVRGYLAARVVRGQSRYAFVWDVYDRDLRRAFRISGEETGGRVGRRDPWTGASAAVLERIAHAGVAQVADFLAGGAPADAAPAPAPEPAPVPPAAGPAVARADTGRALAFAAASQR